MKPDPVEIIAPVVFEGALPSEGTIQREATLVSNDRNATIMRMVSEGKTYAAIGVHFGISRERIRQIAEKIGAAPVRTRLRKASARVKTLRVGDKTASKTGLRLDRLRELLHYDEYTGVFRWRVDRSGRIKAGDIAGAPNDGGYVQIRIDHKLYMASVLAWFYSFERWPDNMIDHQNRVPGDNRLNNLRQATPTQNRGNCTASKKNTSGFKGVWKRGNKWVAEVAHVKLGIFGTPEEAAAKVAESARERYGEFACLDLAVSKSR